MIKCESGTLILQKLLEISVEKENQESHALREEKLISK